MELGRLTIFCLTLLCLGVQCHLIDDLTDSMFTNYNEAVRPNCQTNDTTAVDLFMSLRQIIDINEPQQIIKLNVWVRMKWRDCRLRWNPPDFGNITGFVVPYNNVWVPDVTLYDKRNTEEIIYLSGIISSNNPQNLTVPDTLERPLLCIVTADHVLNGLKDYRANLNYRGDITYNFPSVITSVCALDIRYFPFDFQNCLLAFGSWAYNGWEVNVTHSVNKIELDSFIENSEWRLLDAYITRIEPLYSGVPYPIINFHLQLKRKPLFYIVNVVFPCLLITVMASLGFLLPPDSGEKISLQVTVLLSLAVFQLVILDMIPASGDSFPFISLYFTFSMTIVAVSCLLTVVVLRIHFKGKHGVRLSENIKKYLLIPLTKITFMDLNRYSLRSTTTQVFNENFNPITAISRHNSIASQMHNGDYHSLHQDKGDNFPLHQDKKIIMYLESILQNIGRINDFINGCSQQTEVEKWWNVFSQAFDRLFLCLYLICTIAVALILTAPSMKQQ